MTAEYDLTAKMTPYLDRHLVFPIFMFLRESEMYNLKDIDKAELQLLAGTNMIDFIKEKYDEVGEPAPDNLDDRREQVIEDLGSDRNRVLTFLQILEDEDKVKKISWHENDQRVVPSLRA